jgi:hypothetical protein
MNVISVIIVLNALNKSNQIDQINKINEIDQGYPLPITHIFHTKKPASKHNTGYTYEVYFLAIFYPKLPAPLNLSFMFNWGFDQKWVKMLTNWPLTLPSLQPQRSVACVPMCAKLHLRSVFFGHSFNFYGSWILSPGSCLQQKSRRRKTIPAITRINVNPRGKMKKGGIL